MMATREHRNVDTSRVIDEVRLRKCLWDASDPQYKNKDARNKAWEDVADVLFENTTEENEKQQNLKILQQRWRTARDAFFKTKAAMKNQPSGSSAKKYKKYIYYDELMFLNPSTENDFDESITSPPLVNVSSPDNTDSTENIASPENSTSPATLSANIASPENTVTSENTQRASNPESQNPWAQKRKYRQRQTNQETSPFEQGLLTLLSNQTPDLAADDLAFFSSLGPILRSFDVEQKLEFRSRVLQEATAVKDMRKSPSSSASTPRFSPQYDTDTYTAGTSSGYNYMYGTPTGYQTTGYRSDNHNN